MEPTTQGNTSPAPSFRDIKTFEDACRITGKDPAQVIRYTNPQNADEENSNAYEMMKVIRKAIVGDFVADWSNWNQRKWFPVFKMAARAEENKPAPDSAEEKKGSGFGFSRSAFEYSFSLSGAGSRLCYESEEQSDYAALTFLNIYEKLQN